MLKAAVAASECRSMSPEPYVCDLDPETDTTLKVYLFTEVENCEEVREKVVSGEWQCAAVNARLVAAPLQLAVAANRAALAARAGALRTRSVHAETVYNLSPSTSIARSLAAFGAGAGAGEGALLLCVLQPRRGQPAEPAEHAAVAGVRGRRRPLHALAALTDRAALAQHYGLRALPPGANPLDAILTRMATKHFLSH